MKNQSYEFQQDLAFLRKYGRRAGCSGCADKVKAAIFQQFQEIFGVSIHDSPQIPLSFMELLCLALFLIGKRQKQVADLLSLTVNTVDSYEQNIRKKLCVKSRQAACHEALVRCYISLIHKT